MMYRGARLTYTRSHAGGNDSLSKNRSINVQSTSCFGLSNTPKLRVEHLVSQPIRAISAFRRLQQAEGPVCKRAGEVMSHYERNLPKLPSYL